MAVLIKSGALTLPSAASALTPLSAPSARLGVAGIPGTCSWRLVVNLSRNSLKKLLNSLQINGPRPSATREPLGVDAPRSRSDIGHPIEGRRLTKLAVGLPMVQRAEPHGALRVAVIDVMALSRLSAADLAGLALRAVGVAFAASEARSFEPLFIGETPWRTHGYFIFCTLYDVTIVDFQRFTTMFHAADVLS